MAFSEQCVRILQLLVVGKPDSFIQIRNAAFDLLRRGFQEFPPFICKRILAVQGFVDAAVYLRQLFRGKEGAGREKAGTDGEVPFGGLVTVGAATGAVVMALPKRSLVTDPFPGSKLRPVLGHVPGENNAVEFRQELVSFAEFFG